MVGPLSPEMCGVVGPLHVTHCLRRFLALQTDVHYRRTSYRLPFTKDKLRETDVSITIRGPGRLSTDLLYFSK